VIWSAVHAGPVAAAVVAAAAVVVVVVVVGAAVVVVVAPSCGEALPAGEQADRQAI
jgi:hypothetical protein